MRTLTLAATAAALTLTLAACDDTPTTPDEAASVAAPSSISGELVTQESAVEVWDLPVRIHIDGSIVGAGRASLLRDWQGDRDATLPARASISVTEFRGTPVDGGLRGYADVVIDDHVVRSLSFSMQGSGDLAGLRVKFEAIGDPGIQARTSYQGDVIVPVGG